MNTVRFPRALAFLAFSALLGSSVLAAKAAKPGAVQSTAPAPARTVDAADSAFGLVAPDPYRWMEGRDNTEFQSWIKAEAAYTRTRLDSLPSLAKWRERLSKASGDVVSNNHLQRAGGRIFFVRSTGKGSGTLMVRDADGGERVLLDPAKISASDAASKGSARISRFAPSPDGSKVALNIDRGGDEVTRIEVIDVATGKTLPDFVDAIWGEFSANWLADGKAFFYTQMAPVAERIADNPLSSLRVRLHRLGTKTSDDPYLLRSGEGKGANPSFPVHAGEMPVISPVPDSDWALAFGFSSRAEQRTCVAKQAAAIKPDARWRCLVEFDDAVGSMDGSAIALGGDTLYLLSRKDAPNGRVLAIDLSKSAATLTDAKVTVPSGEAVITAISSARDGLYLREMRNGIDAVRRLDYNTGKIADLPMPFAGSTPVFDTTPNADGVLILLEGWTQPRVAYVYDLDQKKFRDLKLGADAPNDYSMLSSIETVAVSADGTPVPLSIVYRKDIKRDGKARAILNGYGGYGYSQQPNFNTSLLEWVKAGGIAATAHVRGGGEKGEAWHHAGQGAGKVKGIEDMMACAAELAKLGYTSVSRTALEGASMGGLLVGGAVTRFPQKIGAAIIEVGVLTPYRLWKIGYGAENMAEFGLDPNTAPGNKVLIDVDPYLSIKDGVKYPPVLMPVGLNDNRLPSWITGKFAARLRATSASGNPVWIRGDSDEGHGLGSSFDARAQAYADIFAFLDAELPRHEDPAVTSAHDVGDQQP